MKQAKPILAAVLAGLLLVPPGLLAANHRSAPINALDHAAGFTDVYAFRSYGPGDTTKVTMIITLDPFLEPGNGPVWFPFDSEILYEIKVDNNHDAVEDIIFQFRFQTELRLPDLFQVYAGIGPSGAVAPFNSPAPVAPGTLVVPPQIDSFDDPGLGLRQSYTVTMIENGLATELTNWDGSPFFAVPANVGPRTMDYEALFNAGTYHVSDSISLFAGTTDDAFWLDLGGVFDTVNLRTLGSGIAAVLTDTEDAATVNYASDEFSGYAVNAIAIEVPIAMLTSTGQIEPASSPAATIGIWGTTSRPRVTIRRTPGPGTTKDREKIGDFRQVARMGNPLINELFIGIGSKNRFSMDEPKNDGQFQRFFDDPALARVLNALTGGVVPIPDTPRADLAPLVTYAPPIAAPGTPPGPVADLLRLNTGIAPTPVASASRLGVLAGDMAGFPNGRRVFDDVTDIALRVVVGFLAGPPFNQFPNNRLGDGVNVNDAPYRTSFPYLANAPSGRDSRHVDPGEAGCTDFVTQDPGNCPID